MAAENAENAEARPIFVRRTSKNEFLFCYGAFRAPVICGALCVFGVLCGHIMLTGYSTGFDVGFFLSTNNPSFMLVATMLPLLKYG
jgi:hypothetical protein